jgi:hypothetical protein
MNKLNPTVLFERIANDVPKALHEHLFVTGSLAAAYHYKAKLLEHAVNTKDADLVVHPAGHVTSCEQMARQLREVGWQNTDECYPQANAGLEVATGGGMTGLVVELQPLHAS